MNLIESIDTQTLVRLILNPRSEKLLMSTKSKALPKEPHELEFDEQLKLCASQKYRLSEQQRNKFVLSQRNNLINQHNRKSFILLFSNASYNKLHQPGYYELLLRQKKFYPERYFCSIEKDINRTFVQEHSDAQKLRNILCAYAIRNPNLLYCQGLNYVVGFLIINQYSEQESFWILASLIQEVLPTDYYIELGSIICLNSVFNTLMKQILPEFMEFCTSLHLETSFFFIEWLVCLFTKGFTNSLSSYFFELIVIEKHVALVKIAIVLIQLIFPNLEHLTQLGLFIHQVQQQVLVIRVCDFKLKYQQLFVHPALFELLFNNFRKEYDNKPRLHEIHKIHKDKKNSFPVCSPEYPVCLHILQINRKFKGVINVETMKVKPDLDEYLQQDYFCQKAKYLLNQKKQWKVLDDIDEVLIGRHLHICCNAIRSRSNAICDINDMKSDQQIQNSEEMQDIKEIKTQHQGKVEVQDQDQDQQKQTQKIKQTHTSMLLKPPQESGFDKIVNEQEPLVELSMSKQRSTKIIYEELSSFFEVDPDFEGDFDNSFSREDKDKQVKRLENSGKFVQLPRLLTNIAEFFKKYF